VIIQNPAYSLTTAALSGHRHSASRSSKSADMPAFTPRLPAARNRARKKVGETTRFARKGGHLRGIRGVVATRHLPHPERHRCRVLQPHDLRWMQASVPIYQGEALAARVSAAVPTTSRARDYL